MQIRRVALILNMSGIAGRAMLQGASSYAKANLHWTCNIRPPDLLEIDSLKKWNPQGILLESWGQHWTSQLSSMGIPIVQVGPAVTTELSLLGKPCVGVDSYAVGAMSAKYYLEKGYRQLVYIGLERSSAELERERGFTQTAEEASVTCSTCYLKEFSPTHSGSVDLEDRLAPWLSNLSPPVGILAANDGRGLQVLEVMRQHGLNSPDDYAVMGVDDDGVLCEAIYPPLSSVVLPWERVGFEAAVLLDRLMGGKTPSEISLLLPPVRINTRRSSDALAIHDEDLAAAVRFIRQHASSPIQVEDVIQQVNISRRSLERRFMATLGHTLLDEIHSAHLDAAKQLLIHTDLSMPEVAKRSGFSDDRRLWGAFRTATKLSPSDFRKRFRLR
jgi:LacI family transcriptional regulator